MLVQLTMVSGNRKVGPIPVSTTSKETCPPNCALLDTDCYARFGPLGILWSQINKGAKGMQWAAFIMAVSKFLKNTLWRHNQAGDLPGKDGYLDKQKCRELSAASRHTRGFTYTHYSPLIPHNREVIAEMNSQPGMTVNLSADSLAQVDEYYAMGIGPVTCILPEDAKHLGNKTPGGLHIAVCPAQTVEGMSCYFCQLCWIKERKAVVGFLAHATAKKRLSERVRV